MNQKIYILIGFVLYSVAPAYSESLLQAVQFPKVFNDVPFQEKYDVLAEGYGAFDTVYDSKTGKCISGCTYSSLTIEQEQKNTDDATQYFADLMNQATSGETSVNTNIGSWQNSDAPSESFQHISTGSLPMRSPIDTNISITSDFGWRDYSGGSYFHGGVDIGVPQNTTVYATGDGVVTRVASDNASGKYIEIKHDYGLYTQYMHLNQQNVVQGQSVRAGDVIGLSGNTGRSTGAHLDYRIYTNINGTRAFIDVLCPQRSTFKNNQEANTIDNYTNAHSAFNHNYKFSSCQTKMQRVDWRIKHHHCMDGSSRTQLLPDEVAVCK